MGTEEPEYIMFSELPSNVRLSLSADELKQLDSLTAATFMTRPTGTSVNPRDLITAGAEAGNLNVSESDMDVLEIALLAHFKELPKAIFSELPVNLKLKLSADELERLQTAIIFLLAGRREDNISFYDVVLEGAKAANVKVLDSDAKALARALRARLEKTTMEEADEGDPQARENLRLLGLSAIQAERDSVRQAAMAGDVKAMYAFGMIRLYGYRMPKGFDELRRSLQEAAAEGRLAEAKQWLEKAAAQGHSEAMSKLASLYLIGVGVPYDRKKALHLAKNAAAAGSATAKNLLKDIGESPNSSKCFIASAVYGNFNEPDVQTLRRFRDNLLLRYRYGQKLVVMYERIAPSVAARIVDRPMACWLVRVCFVRPLARSLEKIPGLAHTLKP